MQMSHSFLFGIYKKRVEIYVTMKLKHIELYEETKLFGITIKKIEKELYVPDIKKEDIANFKALAGCLLYLHELGLQIEEVKKNAAHH